MEPLALQELVRRCQRTLPDDPRAFEQLVAQYKARGFTMADRLMGNRQEAEDQAQEVFLKVYRSIKTLNDPAAFVGWLDRITTNTCFDALNKQQRRPATTSLTPQPDTADDEPRWIDACSLSPEETALRQELRECLARTLARLDLTGRAALILRDIEDHSYQEQRIIGRACGRHLAGGASGGGGRGGACPAGARADRRAAWRDDRGAARLQGLAR